MVFILRPETTLATFMQHQPLAREEFISARHDSAKPSSARATCGVGAYD